MNSLTIDIKNVTIDYLENNGDATLEELLEYTLSILKEFYDKKFYKKNIYPEFVKQIICRCNIPKFGKYFNNFIVKDRSKTFQTLNTISNKEHLNGLKLKKKV